MDFQSSSSIINYTASLTTFNLVRSGILKYLVWNVFLSVSEGIFEIPFQNLRRSSNLRKNQVQLSIFVKPLFFKLPPNFCFLNWIKIFNKLFQTYVILKFVYTSKAGPNFFSFLFLSFFEFLFNGSWIFGFQNLNANRQINLLR